MHFNWEMHLLNNNIQTEALICPFVLQMVAVFNNNLCLWTVKLLKTFAVSVSLWDLVVNVEINVYKKRRLISLDRQKVVLLVLILTQKKEHFCLKFFFSLQIIVSVKMLVTFSFIKVHSPVVIFTLLLREMKLTLMHAGETEWLARISVCLLLCVHSEYKKALLYLVSKIFWSADYCCNKKTMSAFRKWNKIQGKNGDIYFKNHPVYIANPAEQN